MENQFPNNYDNSQDFNPVSPPNSIQQLSVDSGIQDAIDQENYINQGERQYSSNEAENAALGNEAYFPDAEESDEYNDFIEEEIIPKKKRKKHNDSKEKIHTLTSKIEKERAEKEEALIRFELAEKENQRLKDENEFLALHTQKEKLEREEEELSQMWKIAHAEGDLDSLQDITKDFNKITQLKEVYERNIETVKSRYQTNFEEEKVRENFDTQLQEAQKEAIQQFSDIRELNSPLNDGFLRNHNFLDPRDTQNYDANLVERVEPIKYELIQELKLNGQADEIGTTEYYTELSMRIHENLNPRYKKRDDNMRNNRYQEPDYRRVRTQLDQQAVQHQYQQQLPYQQQQMQQNAYNQGNYAGGQGYPSPQQFQQQQPQHQQPQHSVAPVNRAGYNNNYMNDPNNIQLDSSQQDAADLFGNTLNELSQAVYGRSMGRDEVQERYKQGLIKQYSQGR
jgi:hypothetical protein